MDCRQYLENLTAFMDGELSPADSEKIQSHLQHCHSCSEELQSLREAAEFLESHHRQLTPNPESWNLVRARIGETSATPSSRFSIFNRFRWAMASLAAVAILTFGYVEYQRVQERNFERYVSQYMQQRESQIIRESTSKNPFEGNPFLDVNDTFTGNPFLPEDR
jgi:anti-sigma factor RsiW